MKRALLSAVALVAVLVPGVGGAAGGNTRITAVDTSAYPSVRVTVVTPQPAAKAPKLSEDGQPVIGYTAKNFGREKSVVLLFDRSQSMLGRAMQDAIAAATFLCPLEACERPDRGRCGREAGLPADRLLVRDVRGRLSAARARSRQGSRHRTLRRSHPLVRAPLLRRAPGPRPRAAYGRAGGLEQGEPRGCDRRRERCARHGLSDRNRKPELQAGTAQAPRRRDGRPLQRRSRNGLSPRDLRGARTGAPPDVAAHLLHDRPSRRLVRAHCRGGTRQGVGAWNREPRPPRSRRCRSRSSRWVRCSSPRWSALCVLIGAIFLLQAPVGAGLRRRLAPHIGEPERKRSRGPVRGALCHRFVADARDRAGVRQPERSGTSCTGCWSGPTCRCARSSSRTSASARRFCSP